jgi:CBS domain-containing protein
MTGHIWVLDFVADVLESGRRFRVFNVADQFTRTGLATEVDTSLPSARIVRVLDRLLSEHDKPLLIVFAPGDNLKRAMSLMTNHRVRHLPVIANGNLVGIVSIGDVVKLRLEDLETESNVLRDVYIAAR